MFPRSLSVVIPAYNEEKILPQWISEIVAYLRSHIPQFELIVVDDGSRDETRAVLENLKDRFPEVRVIHHAMNQGYGISLQEGFSACRFEWIFFTDADRQFQIADLSQLWRFCAEAPVMVGYRKKRFDSWVRQFLSAGYNQLIRLLFGLRVRDINCAFKLIRSDVLKTLTLKSRRFFVNTELFIRLRRRGVPIREIAVNHRPRPFGTSTIRFSEIPQTLQEITSFYLGRV